MLNGTLFFLFSHGVCLNIINDLTIWLELFKFKELASINLYQKIMEKRSSVTFKLIVKFGDQGIVVDGPTPEKFVAAKYSSGKVVITINLFLIITLVSGFRNFLTVFIYGKNSHGMNCVCANCSSSLFFMICCRIKKQVSCFLVPCLLIIQDEAFFKSFVLTSKTWKSK